ncbi:MAG: hemin uptake protein HemP [Pseudomonadota bacterium]
MMDQSDTPVSGGLPSRAGQLKVAAPGQARTIDARSLFGDAQVVLIEYRGECYQLRQTRNGKLILTK